MKVEASSAIINNSSCSSNSTLDMEVSNSTLDVEVSNSTLDREVSNNTLDMEVSNNTLDVEVSNNTLHLTTHCEMSVLFFYYNLKDNLSGSGSPTNITIDGVSSCKNSSTDVKHNFGYKHIYIHRFSCATKMVVQNNAE